MPVAPMKRGGPTQIGPVGAQHLGETVKDEPPNEKRVEETIGFLLLQVQDGQGASGDKTGVAQDLQKEKESGKQGLRFRIGRNDTGREEKSQGRKNQDRSQEAVGLFRIPGKEVDDQIQESQAPG